jgi:hypothetical protein
MWKCYVLQKSNCSILEKYQKALTLTNNKLFETDTRPYQDANLLIFLRNDLVHYKPKTIKVPSSDDYVPDDIHRNEKRLRNKFALNPLVGAGNPFYPDKCLSHGCAEWAINTSIMFADNFYATMGLSCPYEHIRSNLETK